MPLLRKPILKPIIGLNYMDPSTMLNDRGGFPKNMRLSRNDMRKREGRSLHGTSPISDGAAAIHHVEYPLNSQVIRLVRFSKAKAEKYNASSGAWDDITGADFNGGDTDFFSTVVAEDKLIISNYVDAIRTYNDAGNTTDLVPSVGSAWKAKFLEYNKGYLLGAYLEEAGQGLPTKVGWTDIGDITKFSGGNSGSALLYHDPLPIRGMKNLNEFTVAYKKNSIYAGRLVDTSDVFIFDLIFTGIGLMSHRTLVDSRGRHFFMGLDDFYSFSGIRPESIGIDSVQREVFSRLDANKTDRNFAILNSEFDEIWFFVVIAGQDWPTEIWKYNYRTGFWYFDTCSALCSAAIYYQQASVAWNDLTGSWAEQNYRWNDKLLTTNFPFVVFGTSDGYTLRQNTLVNDDNAVAIDASWESIDFVADKFENYHRWLELDFEAKGNTVKVEYSTDYGTTWKSIKTQTLTSDWPVKPYKVYFDVVARNIRFRFSNAISGETFYLRQFYPYYLDNAECNR